MDKDVLRILNESDEDELFDEWKEYGRHSIANNAIEQGIELAYNEVGDTIKHTRSDDFIPGKLSLTIYDDNKGEYVLEDKEYIFDHNENNANKFMKISKSWAKYEDTPLAIKDFILKQVKKYAPAMLVFDNQVIDNQFPKNSFAEWFGQDLTGQIYEGSIDCSYNKLTSLYGCPAKVTGDFDCSDNYFKSLKYAPQEVEGDFIFYGNELTSLKYAPKYVGGDFGCSEQLLTSLQGAPQKVGGSFDCFNNRLTSLKGAPQEVGGNFDCSDNQLTSLEGAPQYVEGNFDCSWNKLTSLEYSPQKVGGSFYCSNNPNLKSLDGIGEVRGKIYSDIK